MSDDTTRGLLEQFVVPLWMFGDSVEARNALQHSGKVHPYTCGHDRHDAAHAAHAEKRGLHDVGILEATEDGWRCPVEGCSYTQARRK